jgi:hypothetical protein
MSSEIIWNVILSFISGMLILALKDHKTEVKDLHTAINQTKINIAANYVSKAEFQLDFARIMARLDILDVKLDRIIENYRPKGERNNEKDH